MRSSHLVIVVVAFGLVTGCSTSTKKKELTRKERAVLLTQVANGALLEGDPTGALQNLRVAEEYDATLPEIFHSRALAFEAKGDLNQALANAKKAMALAPKSSPVQNTLGKLLLDSGKSQEAVGHLSRAAKDPYYQEAYKAQTNLGILYYRQGDYPRAIPYFNKAIESAAGQSCHAHYYLGHIQLRMGQSDSAVREYKKATSRACARFADAHYALGVALERSKQFDDARKTYLGIRTSFPRSKFAEKAMERLRDIP